MPQRLTPKLPTIYDAHSPYYVQGTDENGNSYGSDIAWSWREAVSYLNGNITNGDEHIYIWQHYHPGGHETQANQDDYEPATHLDALYHWERK